MAAPLAEELERLLNPLPRALLDPEDDPEDATTARVINKFDEGDEDDVLAPGHIRKGVSSHLLDADKRYRGKAVSRKTLEEEMWGDDQLSDEPTSNEEVEIDEEDEDLEDEEDAICSVASSQEEEEEKKQLGKLKKEAFAFQSVDDFAKFAEGMDEMGSSMEMLQEDEEGSAEEGSRDEGYSMEEGSEGGMTSEESAAESEEAEKERVADVGERKHLGGLLPFSKDQVAEEVAKGKAVQNQIALWDQLLEGRIKLQKVLLTANQLPQPDTFLEFKKRGGQEFATALKNNYKALKALLRSLVDLQDEMLHQNSATRHLVDGEQGKEESNEEIPSSDDDGNKAETEDKERKRPAKRKLEMDDYPEFAAKRFADFRSFRNNTLQKWHDRTKLASGKLGKKGFSAFERSILTQIDHILMDQERLLQRTRTKRSVYRVLGKLQPASEPLPTALPGQTEALPPTTSNAHLKDLDEEIFDDDDFYHQLLRELIERKTSSLDPNDQVAMGRQWLAIQKLRSKIRKKVDKKASKGRKIRYHVHSKLVSFMAPIDHSTMTDDARTELYRSLFGKRPDLEGGGCS